MGLNPVALAIPVFFGLIGVEALIARWQDRRVYRLNDGLLRDLGFCASDLASADADFERTAGAGTGR